MKRETVRLALVSILGASITVGAAVAHSETTGIPEADARIAKMKMLGENMKAIAAVAKGEAAYSPDLNKNAAKIASIGKEMPTLFPAGSGGEKTRSKPEIWINKEAFSKSITAFQMASENLQTAVATGDQGKIGQALGATGKTCGGCHKPFRTPKDH
ncbi:c-type cytochrome [Sneathiella aquimaris]|uniref:c-type cytochrome n=1 Tax=Sneathiella aquimaris TaxID=2599305 RepID=UPI00146D2A5F|nr:cytochrome c [Sneathiella aquimaris]